MHMASTLFLRRTRVAFRNFILLCLICLGAAATRAEVRFDVFVGYDGTVREASWFPITCELQNNGPAFTGLIEISPGNFGKGQTQRFPIELPTGTLKRVVIPAFAPSRYQSAWDVRLVDSRGKLRAEALGMRSQRAVGWETKLMGALPRTAAGMVSLRTIKRNQPDAQPTAARFQPAMFPDNPLVLEALDAIYLNSEVAVSLRSSQANALLGWLNAGGHLIVGMEQISDVSGVPWLRNVLPCEPQDTVAVARHEELSAWLKAAGTYTNSPVRAKKGSKSAPSDSEVSAGGYVFGDAGIDPAFEAAEIRVVTGKLRDGQPLVSVDGKPLIITAHRGLGQLTVLMFSPEREPFKSWRELPTLWTVLLDVPLHLYASNDYYSGYGQGVDGIFGAMIDSRQVRKLPVGWLLVLLLVYLLVIGPVDRLWLKKINKPMLTWVTFPCYVLFFSGLIYLIGYKLRAGDSEYNELHVVDVLATGERAELRGRTYASIYSPANAKYALESQLKYATFRGEYLGSRGGDTSDRTALLHTGDNFEAEVLVPVWTSQLFLSDWWQSGEKPVTVSLQRAGSDWQVTVVNRSGKPISEARFVLGRFVYNLGEIPVTDEKVVSLQRAATIPLEEFVNDQAHHYATVAQERQYAFARRSSGQIDDLPTASMVASLLGEASYSQNNARVVLPPGLDLSEAVDVDRGILLAWAPGAAPVPTLNQSKSKRSTVNTLWRIPVSIPTAN